MAQSGRAISKMATSRDARRATSTTARQDLRALESRRLRAARMFDKGASPAEAARKLGVSRQSASRWHRQWEDGGSDALRSTGRRGRTARLSKGELEKVERALLQGARAHGFGTDLWTLERVAQVIHSETGVSYHPGHVWKVLKALGWSLQRPARRAAERDDKAIKQWTNKRWPRVKKTPGQGAPG